MKGLWTVSMQDFLLEAVYAEFKGISRMSVIGMAVHIKTIIASLLHNRQMMMTALCGALKSMARCVVAG